MKRIGSVLALVALVVASACESGSSGVTAGDASKAEGSKTATACATPAADGVKVAKHLVSCLAPSVVLIEVDDAPMGSGLVIAADGEKYVLTNLHVVDPEPTVDVVITGEKAQHRSDVPVVGIDKTADIAVLGPIETDRPPVSLVEPAVERATTSTSSAIRARPRTSPR